MLAAAAAPQPEELHVAAAISLTEALTDVATRYESETGARLRLNFGASNTLARQILAGARVDVFVSADDAQMAVVARAGLVRRQAPVVGNRLVIVVPSDSRRSIRSPADLAASGVRRIALGDPDAVPAGVYAKRYLVATGLWARVRDRVVPTTSVRGALAAVESGSVDAAIVYRTDATVAKRVRVSYEVTGAAAPAIVYPAATLTTTVGTNRFFEFLRSDRAAAIFRRHGFVAPSGR